jgi:phospholipid/cholesterol/gamma-HCH transport system substrate-binding protein
MSPVFKTPEFKVGLLVLVVTGIIATMSLQVSESAGFLGGKKHWFTLENAAGLIKNGPVHVAGIRVGVIKQIGLSDEGLARIDVVIQPGVRLTTSSKVQIRPNGILGDKHIEIVPGNANDPLLASGDRIGSVEDSASLDKLITQVSKVATSLTVVVDNLRDATEGDDSKPIGKIIKNVETLTGDLAQLVREKRGEVSEMITAMKSAMVRIDKAMVNIEEISTKINEGQGTIGRLINDEQMGDSLDSAMETFGFFSDLTMKTDISIEAHTNSIPRQDGFRSYIGANIRTGLDRFYEVGLVSTPVGVLNEKTTTTTVGPGPSTITNEKTVFENEYRFTVLVGKNFYDFGIKAGLIENTGGVGLEYTTLRKRLKIGVDAFDFSGSDNEEDDMKLRPYIRYNIMKGVFVQGGGEDMLNERKRSVFFGAGVFLSSDDLKGLLSRVNL